MLDLLSEGIYSKVVIYIISFLVKARLNISRILLFSTFLLLICNQTQKKFNYNREVALTLYQQKRQVFFTANSKVVATKRKKTLIFGGTARKNVKSFQTFSLGSKRLQLKNDLKLCKIQEIYKLNTVQFKVKSIANVITLKPNVFMASIDQKDVCFLILIHLERQQ